MRDSCCLFIPTRDSARWIGSIIDFHLSLGLTPLVVVDARTKDMTRDIIVSRGMSFLEFEPRGDYPEAGMLEFAAQHANADWILRLDDDELPTKKLINFVWSSGIASKNQCWFIERRELYWENSRVVFSRSPGKYPIPDYPKHLHPMARLYHVDRVKYVEEVHTTGFEELKLYGFAPSEAFMVHLNCLVNNFDARMNKLIAYNQLKPGLAWSLADEYLPELFNSDFHNSSDEGLEEFGAFFLKCSEPLHIKPDQLAQINLDFVEQCVDARIKNLMAAQAASKGGILNADDVSWIELAPYYLRLPLTKFLCSLSDERFKRIGLALWDYLEIHDQMPRG